MPLPPPPGGWPNDPTPPVRFANGRWAATGYGLECVRPGAVHVAEGRRMGERRPGPDLHDWPPHMAEKTWVDLGAFIEAFRCALRRHRPEDFGADRLARSARGHGA